MGAKLVAERGLNQGQEWLLKEQSSSGPLTEWSFGRDPNESLLSVEDSTVSRKHLLIRLKGADYEIENLSKTNPLELNGQKLTAIKKLEHGDLLKIGDTLYRFLLDPPPAGSKVLEAVQDPLKSATSNAENFPTVYYGDAPKDEPGVVVHFSEGRYLLKVLSGPNAGAEFSLEEGKTYTIGSDMTSCDVVLFDLSVSRQHAKIYITKEGIEIEDLKSRNGILIGQEPLQGKKHLAPNQIVSLGTTTFAILDREGRSETIIAPAPTPAIEPVKENEKEEAKVEIKKEPALDEAALAKQKTLTLELEKIKKRNKSFQTALTGVVLAVIFAGVSFAITVHSVALFRQKEVEVPRKDYALLVAEKIRSYPEVQFTFNKTTGKLFLSGHVLSQLDKAQLYYLVKSLSFVVTIDDHVIVDEYIWQEMNQILASMPQWKGISMHAPRAGLFVVNGYLLSLQQYSNLQDYLNLNFPYLDRLENRVVVEESLFTEIQAAILQNGLEGVIPELSNGSLFLSGYIGGPQVEKFDPFIEYLKGLPGIRMVTSAVVKLSEAQTMINLTGKYAINGFSSDGLATVGVVINGQIFFKGDLLDGMQITSINDSQVVLEKDGLKYKIEYKQ